MNKEKLIAAMREVANYNYSCTCIEAYKGREMVDPGCHYCNVFDDTFLSDLAEAAQKELGNEWVRAEDRLPERSGYYLCYDYGLDLVCCYYFDADIKAFRPNRHSPIEWALEATPYWMNLPSPPKDK